MRPLLRQCARARARPRPLLTAASRYQEESQAATEEFQTGGIERAKMRDEEMRRFEAAVERARVECEARAVGLIEMFAKRKKRAFRDIDARESIAKSDFEPLLADLDTLRRTLMDSEIHLTEQFEELFAVFTTKFDAIKAAMADAQQNLWAQPSRPICVSLP